jgi:uncharacterized Ntn-hydrolase superfamily protein
MSDRRIAAFSAVMARMAPAAAAVLLAIPPAGAAEPSARRPVHTYSIVARDPKTGEMGVAVQSHWFSVGPVVPWAEAGVGAVATQSLVEISYGPLGLDLMRAGRSATEALTALLAADSSAAVRQVAMVDAKGRIAVHTGERCIAFAGDSTGAGFSVQANLMASPAVWPAMAAAYTRAEGDLAERMLAALDAGEEAGGDIRGRQSAAILIVKAEASGRPWVDRTFDLRVEDHPQPNAELRRLVILNRAYARMNRGDELVAENRFEEATVEYRAAAELAPGIVELPFWQAVTLVSIGQVEEALPIFRQVFAREPAWATLTPRLVPSRLLPDDPALLARILSVAPAAGPSATGSTPSSSEP